MSSERTDNWFDHLVYMRVFEGCNLHCKHCFIPANPKRMSLEQVETVPEILSSRVDNGSNILLQFHGGEPTLMGYDWLDSAANALKENGSEFNWRFSIQTNLMHYDEKWSELFHRHFKDGLGVSWDEKIRLTHKGKDESYQNFEKIFWQNIDAMLADGLTPRLVITVTKPLIDAYRVPYRLIEKLMNRGIHDIHFEKLTKTGMARTFWDEIGVNNQEYSSWMSKLMDTYLMLKQNPDLQLNISPLDGLLETTDFLMNGEAKGGSGCWSNVCDTRFHTIDANGYKSGCTALTSEEDNKAVSRMGVQIIRLEDIVGSRNHRRSEYHCASCDFKPVCSSGCLAADIDDGSGECSGHYQLFSKARGLLENGINFISKSA